MKIQVKMQLNLITFYMWKGIEIRKTQQTSMRIARSTTIPVIYPRTKLIMLLATDDEPMSTSICTRKQQ